MVCPKCGHEQPDVFSQCGKCRYIFPAPAANASQVPPIVPRAPRDTRPRPTLLSILGAVAAVILLLGVFWLLFAPQGLPVAEESYVNETHQFAMMPPSQWITLTSDNYREVFHRLGDRFPRNLQSSLDQHRIEVGFLKADETLTFSPNMNVVVIKGNIPELDETQKGEATQALVEVFTGMLDSYKLEKSELTTIDELTSLHFASRAVMKMKVTEGEGFTETRPGRGTITHEAPAVWKEFDLRLTQTLIPGNNRAYIISCTAEASQFPRFQHTFENAIESFRVLERPPRYGPILTGALQGGLTAAMLPLLFYIVMGVITLVRRGVR